MDSVLFAEGFNQRNSAEGFNTECPYVIICENMKTKDYIDG